MNDIRLLDCTLRDGGYCNQWKFGSENAKKIIKSLLDAKIDIIECGFLTDQVKYTSERTKFNVPAEVLGLLPEQENNTLFVAMINYGEYDINSLPDCDGIGLTGIRLAFHKKDWRNALSAGRAIMEKGYDLFLQPMVTLSYSDREFLELIFACNQVEPYAFYIVDSFGTMKKKDLLRYYYLTEYNLNSKIAIGLHSHDNLQLAYVNAQTFTDCVSQHDMIVDCSIYGMGRGAGNLNTEIFIDYANSTLGKSYCVRPLISVIDQVLDGFYQVNRWGYSLSNYVAAVHNAHPNYAGYFSDKNALNVEDIDKIFDGMAEDKKTIFDSEYAESVYLEYLSKRKISVPDDGRFEATFQGKVILLIAPGKSSFDEQKIIKEFSQKDNIITVSVNYEYPYINIDYIFISNLRRFRQLEKEKWSKCIVTSNIPAEQVCMKTSYEELLNSNEAVKDNAGLMAIKFFMRSGAEKILLAGFDGYTHDSEDNYADEKMLLYTKRAAADAMNEGMALILNECKQYIDIAFLTHPRNVII